MESARIARCSYRAITVMIALFQHSKFADICNEICLRFKELKVGKFELTYSLPEHPTCLLQSDMDVHLMLTCLSMLKISFVDILVKDLVISNKEDETHAIYNQVPHSPAVSNHAVSDCAPVNNTVPDHASPGVPNHALSDNATSHHTASDDAPSSDATSNQAASNHAMSHNVISDQAVCDGALSNEVARNCALSKHETFNQVASPSCMFNTNAIDVDKHLGILRSNQGDTLSESWKEYINHVGQKFEGGVVEFRNKLCMYAFAIGFRFVYLKNEKERVVAECFKKTSDGCNWRVHASVCRLNGCFYIKKLNNVHSCTGVIREEKIKLMSSKIISSVLVDQIREKPSIKPADIVKDFKKSFGLDISYQSAWHAKEMAKSEILGDETSSYSQLAWYSDALVSTNPGSHCVLECDPTTSRFQRLFICYSACIEGFRWCRPLLFINITFLESKHKGQLIGATGKNGNQGSFPFAFAIVDSENEENWRWFFENLAKVLAKQGRTVTFVSDHNKGLIEAVSNMFPTSYHGFCLNNLKQNLLSKYPATCGKFFRDRIVDLFLKCAYAPTEAAFKIQVGNFKHEGGAPVMTFLEDIPKENWSYVYFKGNRYGEMCNNVSESFNSWSFELCTLPICKFVDGIRIKLMKLMDERRREAEQWCSVLCPEMERTLDQLLVVGRNWNVSRRSSGSVYDVHAEVYVMVDLANHLCFCGEWQIKGFPCAHAFVAAHKGGCSIYDYIDDHFKTSYFRSSYGSHISPVPDMKDVMHEGSEDVIMPPLTKKRRGRARTVPDINNVMHKGLEVVIPPPLPKKRRGRPRTVPLIENVMHEGSEDGIPPPFPKRRRGRPRKQ